MKGLFQGSSHSALVGAIPTTNQGKFDHLKDDLEIMKHLYHLILMFIIFTVLICCLLFSNVTDYVDQCE